MSAISLKGFSDHKTNDTSLKLSKNIYFFKIICLQSPNPQSLILCQEGPDVSFLLYPPRVIAGPGLGVKGTQQSELGIEQGCSRVILSTLRPDPGCPGQ